MFDSYFRGTFGHFRVNGSYSKKFLALWGVEQRAKITYIKIIHFNFFFEVGLQNLKNVEGSHNFVQNHC